MSDRQLLLALLRNDFGSFLAKALATVHPGTPFLPNWHIDAIVHELMRITSGENNRLIINQPPRSLKSITVSVAYVAWVLGHHPGKRIIVVSYNREFAAVLHGQFRVLVNSRWYRQIFPRTVWTKTTDTDIVTLAGGGRVATSIGGTITGRGADMIIIDDPLNANDAQSEAARNNVISYFGGALFTRLNNKARDPIIVVAQRLHEDDLPGHLKREGGWTMLRLPAVAIEDSRIALGNGRTHFRRAGDILQPDRESRSTLDKIKQSMGSIQFSAQYQQAPVPIEGNLAKREWFKFYPAVPERGYHKLVQSWDIATMTGEHNDYSVCTTWLVRGNEVYLVAVWRDRLPFPDIRRKVIELASQYRPDTILIEDAGAGSNLLQDLHSSGQQGIVRPIGCRPDGDKRDRFVAASARIEAGMVFFPKDAPWLAVYINELLGFPGTRHDDQVDSTSQFLNWWWSSPSRLAFVPTPIVVYGGRRDPFDHPDSLGGRPF